MAKDKSASASNNQKLTATVVSKLIDKNSRTIAKISQLLAIVHRGQTNVRQKSNTVIVMNHIDKLKHRLNRRLQKLAKWADSPGNEPIDLQNYINNSKSVNSLISYSGIPKFVVSKGPSSSFREASAGSGSSAAVSVADVSKTSIVFQKETNTSVKAEISELVSSQDVQKSDAKNKDTTETQSSSMEVSQEGPLIDRADSATTSTFGGDEKEAFKTLHPFSLSNMTRIDGESALIHSSNMFDASNLEQIQKQLIQESSNIMDFLNASAAAASSLPSVPSYHVDMKAESDGLISSESSVSVSNMEYAMIENKALASVDEVLETSTEN